MMLKVKSTVNGRCHPKRNPGQPRANLIELPRLERGLMDTLMERSEQCSPDRSKHNRGRSRNKGQRRSSHDETSAQKEGAELQGQSNYRRSVTTLLKRSERLAGEERPVFKAIVHADTL
jgi:hypothetical protein